jgi:hypothetical protein
MTFFGQLMVAVSSHVDRSCPVALSTRMEAALFLTPLQVLCTRQASKSRSQSGCETVNRVLRLLGLGRAATWSEADRCTLHGS